MLKLFKLLWQKKYNTLISIISIAVGIAMFFFQVNIVIKILGISQTIIVQTLNFFIIWEISLSNCCKKRTITEKEKNIEKGRLMLNSLQDEISVMTALNRDNNDEESISLLNEIKNKYNERKNLYEN